ncbi:hypothetical protein BC828DRAFT_418446 [Blastocladiella britannica]|nr:hypothetical protein BC828DRAFT_418446 [Blastocladiella britannica]
MMATTPSDSTPDNRESLLDLSHMSLGSGPDADWLYDPASKAAAAAAAAASGRTSAATTPNMGTRHLGQLAAQADAAGLLRMTMYTDGDSVSPLDDDGEALFGQQGGGGDGGMDDNDPAVLDWLRADDQLSRGSGGALAAAAASAVAAAGNGVSRFHPPPPIPTGSGYHPGIDSASLPPSTPTSSKHASLRLSVLLGGGEDLMDTTLDLRPLSITDMKVDLEVQEKKMRERSRNRKAMVYLGQDPTSSGGALSSNPGGSSSSLLSLGSDESATPTPHASGAPPTRGMSIASSIDATAASEAHFAAAAAARPGSRPTTPAAVASPYGTPTLRSKSPARAKSPAAAVAAAAAAAGNDQLALMASLLQRAGAAKEKSDAIAAAAPPPPTTAVPPIPSSGSSVYNASRRASLSSEKSGASRASSAAYHTYHANHRPVPMPPSPAPAPQSQHQQPLQAPARSSARSQSRSRGASSTSLGGAALVPPSSLPRGRSRSPSGHQRIAAPAVPGSGGDDLEPMHRVPTPHAATAPARPFSLTQPADLGVSAESLASAPPVPQVMTRVAPVPTPSPVPVQTLSAFGNSGGGTGVPRPKTPGASGGGSGIPRPRTPTGAAAIAGAPGIFGGFSGGSGIPRGRTPTPAEQPMQSHFGAPAPHHHGSASMSSLLSPGGARPVKARSPSRSRSAAALPIAGASPSSGIRAPSPAFGSTPSLSAAAPGPSGIRAPSPVPFNVRRGPSPAPLPMSSSGIRGPSPAPTPHHASSSGIRGPSPAPMPYGSTFSGIRGPSPAPTPYGSGIRAPSPIPPTLTNTQFHQPAAALGIPGQIGGHGRGRSPSGAAGGPRPVSPSGIPRPAPTPTPMSSSGIPRARTPGAVSGIRAPSPRPF